MRGVADKRSKQEHAHQRWGWTALGRAGPVDSGTCRLEVSIRPCNPRPEIRHSPISLASKVPIYGRLGSIRLSSVCMIQRTACCLPEAPLRRARAFRNRDRDGGMAAAHCPRAGSFAARQGGDCADRLCQRTQRHTHRHRQLRPSRRQPRHLGSLETWLVTSDLHRRSPPSRGSHRTLAANQWERRGAAVSGPCQIPGPIPSGLGNLAGQV